MITGAHAQLAGALKAEFDGRGPVVLLTRSELDVRDHGRVVETFDQLRPAVVLNCASFNDVDGAEHDAEAAFAVNAIAVRSLAREAARHGATLVHYSTDFVFDGRATAPYSEDDKPNPGSVYAASKLVGEWFARDAGRWYVLRVESLFGTTHVPGSPHVGSLDRIIEALEARRPLKAVHDRVASPTYLLDAAAATAALLGRGAPWGLYHVVNSGHATWLDIAREAARHVGGGEHIEPVSAADLNLEAPRPLFAALSNARLARAAFVMPSWQDALARYLSFRASLPKSS
ncbi:MAG: dTDP-4-dehydrorhamnose reductase [Acidobacteriota bacterium]